MILKKNREKTWFSGATPHAPLVTMRTVIVRYSRSAKQGMGRLQMLARPPAPAVMARVTATGTILRKYFILPEHLERIRPTRLKIEMAPALPVTRVDNACTGPVVPIRIGMLPVLPAIKYILAKIRYEIDSPRQKYVSPATRSNAPK